MEKLEIASQEIERKLNNKGVEKFAYTVTEGKKEEFTAKNSKFTLLRTTFSSSFSLSVFIGGRKGTGSCSDLSGEAVEKTVDDAIASALSSEPDEAHDIAPGEGRMDIDRLDDDNLQLFFTRLTELLEYIKVTYQNLIVMDTVGEHTHFETIYHNSNGTDYHSTGGFYEFYLGYSAHEGDVTSGMNYSSCLTKTLERPFIELGSIRSELESKSKSLNTVSFGEKFTGTVIFTPGCLGQFLSYILSNISDTMIQNGVSIWKDKLNEKVADERISIRLESSNKDIVCRELITDDGYRTEDVTVLEKGILKSFLLSLYAANKTGNSVTKNSSRDIVMDGGDETLESLIKKTERGLIIGGFSGGHPSVSGDFSGVAKSSFYIENGEIKGAVNETMVNGNLLSMLNSIRGITKERVSDGSSILPYLAVDGIVISGR